MSRVNPSDATSPSTTPTPTRLHPAREDQAYHVVTLCAQRYTDTDFARAPRHHGGNHAINAHQRQQQRERREHHQQRHLKAARRDGSVQALGQGARLEQCDAGQRAALRADGADQRRGIGGGAHHQLRSANRILRRRQVYLGFHFRIQLAA